MQKLPPRGQTILTKVGTHIVKDLSRKLLKILVDRPKITAFLIQAGNKKNEQPHPNDISLSAVEEFLSQIVRAVFEIDIPQITDFQQTSDIQRTLEDVQATIQHAAGRFFEKELNERATKSLLISFINDIEPKIDNLSTKYHPDCTKSIDSSKTPIANMAAKNILGYLLSKLKSNDKISRFIAVTDLHGFFECLIQSIHEKLPNSTRPELPDNISEIIKGEVTLAGLINTDNTENAIHLKLEKLWETITTPTSNNDSDSDSDNDSVATEPEDEILVVNMLSSDKIKRKSMEDENPAPLQRQRTLFNSSNKGNSQGSEQHNTTHAKLR